MDSRPPPPQGAPPSYAFVTRMYSRNLRPIVLSCAISAGLWSLFSGIGFFRNATTWSDNHQGTLQFFSILVGALYMVVLAIELFGLFAATKQRVALVRIFAYLSGLVFLIIAAVGLIGIVLHFKFKDAIINTCAIDNTGDNVLYPGFFGPVHAGTLTAAGAQEWCRNQWNRSTWSEIIAFLFTSALAFFYAAIAFSYLRQVLDPTSPANLSREPARAAGGAFPARYNPPFYPAYAPPAGPPPGQQSQDVFVAPPYDADGKPPGYARGEDFKGDYGDAKKGSGYGWGADQEGLEHGEASERDVTSRAGRNPFI